MNRRGFLSGVLKAAAVAVAAPTILPAAVTYAHRWVKKRNARIITPPYDPFWLQTTRFSRIMDDEYHAAFMEALDPTSPLYKFIMEQPQQQAFVDSFFHNKPIPPHLRGPAPGIITTIDCPFTV
jgi:hypothetical protein